MEGNENNKDGLRYFSATVILKSYKEKKGKVIANIKEILNNVSGNMIMFPARFSKTFFNLDEIYLTLQSEDILQIWRNGKIETYNLNDDLFPILDISTFILYYQYGFDENKIANETIPSELQFSVLELIAEQRNVLDVMFHTLSTEGIMGMKYIDNIQKFHHNSFEENLLWLDKIIQDEKI